MASADTAAMRAVLAALLILTGAAGPPMTAPDAPASNPRVEAAVRPVRDAIRTVDAALAALPPATSDAERLIRLARRDQAAREALYGLDLSAMAPGEQAVVLTFAWARVEAVDRANQRALKAMLPPGGGWFTRSAVGPDGAEAAFLVVIHAVRDRGLMREALRRMEPLLGSGEIEDGWYAGLWDRLAVLERRPQRWGTQPVCRGGQWTAGEVEDPDGLAARRAAMGLEGFDARGFQPPPGCG